MDFSTLAPKYKDFVVDFIDKSQEGPFFLYVRRIGHGGSSEGMWAV